MSSTRDFIAATFSDGLLPVLRRPVEDVIYETLDQRQIPNRTDFKELRDLVLSLRGQVTGMASGIRRLAEGADQATDDLADQTESLESLQEQLVALTRRVANLEQENRNLAEQLAAQASSADAVSAVEGDDADVAEGVK
ncbi:MAG TPA: hypothetical protein DFR83_28545 [Deltaproteobacteria bacterium]|nr:hypothetical protein [Deltaproteobacteria bacterium]